MILYLPPVHNFVLGEPNRQQVDSVWSRDLSGNDWIPSDAIASLNLFGVDVDGGDGGLLPANFCRENKAKPRVKYFPQRAPVGSY
jgi:hypothetical protein